MCPFPHIWSYQITGWEHAHEACVISVAVVAGFWASVLVCMAFVVDKVALGALSLSLAICHFITSLYLYCLWPVHSVGCSIKGFGFTTI